MTSMELHSIKEVGAPPPPLRERLASPKQRAFLAAYAQSGFINHAARAAEVDRTSHYYWMEHQEGYPEAFAEAGEAAIERLEAEADRRAVEGWDEPVYGSAGGGGGTVQVGSKRRYSDTLLIFRLKGLAPEKYADRHVQRAHVTGDVSHEHSGTVQVDVRAQVSETLDALHDRLGTELPALGPGGGGSAPEAE